MKKWMWAALVCVVLGGFVAGGWMMQSWAKDKKPHRSKKMTQAELGKPAPVFSLPSAEGKTVSLEQFKDKLVVLEWLNHGCPFVKKHYDKGNMQGLQRNAAEKGVVWLSIVSSAQGTQGYYPPKEAHAMMLEKKAQPTALLLDPEGQVGRMYGARTTPHIYIIDKTGNLVYRGAIDSIRSTNPDDIPKATNYVTQALGELMAGKPVSVAKTRPYGCSVKYKR